jgi:hypothetical protein
MPLMKGEVEKIRDFAIAGYYAMSWSIITEEYSFIHWLRNEKEINQAEFDKILISANPDKKAEMKEEMWTCTAGAKVDVPAHDELYDRKKDPFQLNNIMDKNPKVAKELLQKLKLFIGELRVS